RRLDEGVGEIFVLRIEGVVDPEAAGALGEGADHIDLAAEISGVTGGALPPDAIGTGAVVRHADDAIPSGRGGRSVDPASAAAVDAVPETAGFPVDRGAGAGAVGDLEITGPAGAGFIDVQRVGRGGGIGVLEEGGP